jgi:hypothetical protein
MGNTSQGTNFNSLFIINGCPMVVISRSDISNTTTTLLAYNDSKRQGNSVNDTLFRSPNDGCVIPTF